MRSWARSLLTPLITPTLRVTRPLRPFVFMASSVDAASELPKRPLDSPIAADASRKPKKVKKFRYKEPVIDPISSEGVLVNDIKDLLASKSITVESAVNDMREFFSRPRGSVHPEHKSATVEIEALSSVGSGIALLKEDDKISVVIVPYTLPGEKVEVKIYRTNKYYFEAEKVTILEKSDLRNDELVKCRYFGECSGCHYQMIPYNDQLEIKRQVIVKAFKHYAPKIVDEGLVPTVDATVGSPLEYKYRTKLTPHFDIPRGGLTAPPPVGFGIYGRKAVLDIEECVIGTEVLNLGLTTERAKLHETYSSYKRGATILLRENISESDPSEKTYTTLSKDIITETVGEFKFQYPAGSFFQNNNSILPAVTGYVRDNIVLPDSKQPPKYLVDTYCGCGLFAVTCSPAVDNVIGVEISKDSVGYAEKNAKLNNLENASFIVGQAERIFEKVNSAPEQTSIIIDPPRKGCDKPFLDQLLAFRPAKVVYVSCNVHSQARDIEYLLTSPAAVDSDGRKYQIESLRGFDFFPQTHHVESVAVLSLK